MRENIGLFRGKRIDNGEWIEGFLLKVTVLEKPFSFIFKDAFVYDGRDVKSACRAVVDDDTVGECCGGLKDKNGKVAFEHDVTADQWGRRWIIFRCKGGYGICRDTEWKRNNDCSKMLYNALADAQNADWFSHQHEIIGNIHDNPELLQEGADE